MLSNSLFSAATLLTLLPTATATTLFLSAYSGPVATLQLDKNSAGGYTLRQSAASYTCNPDPSWLTLDHAGRLLYCAGEAVNGGPGSLTTYSIAPSGVLSQLSNVSTINGNVNSVFYGTGNKFLAVAEYGGSSVSTFSLTKPGTPTPLQQFTFKLSKPGPNPTRQDAPHPHQVILDPTGNFILSPDLGMDLVHVFAANKTTGQLTACRDLSVSPGSGPRHATFWRAPNSYAIGPEPSGAVTVMYLVNELANTLVAFRVTYPSATGSGTYAGCPAFTEFEMSNSFGGKAVPVGNAVAEIAIQNNNILVSNRNSSTFGAGNDSLAAFSIRTSAYGSSQTQQGSFKLTQISPAYGSFPRQFSINKNGTLVAIGLQNSGTVQIVKRDPASGTLGARVANLTVIGQPTSVIWDE